MRPRASLSHGLAPPAPPAVSVTAASRSRPRDSSKAASASLETARPQRGALVWEARVAADLLVVRCLVCSVPRLSGTLPGLLICSRHVTGAEIAVVQRSLCARASRGRKSSARCSKARNCKARARAETSTRSSRGREREVSDAKAEEGGEAELADEQDQQTSSAASLSLGG